jgi:hypothetical protein
VDKDSIGTRFFEKPYILVPGKKSEKGYVLFRETLKSARKVGIARVVIRTREYLCAVIPEDEPWYNAASLSGARRSVRAQASIRPPANYGSRRNGDGAAADRVDVGEMNPMHTMMSFASDCRDHQKANQVEGLDHEIRRRARRARRRRYQRRRFHGVAREELEVQQADTCEAQGIQGQSADKWQADTGTRRMNEHGPGEQRSTQGGAVQ